MTAASEETRAWRRASPIVRRWLEEKERKAASLARLKTRRARADVSWIVNRRKHQMAIFRRDRANDEREARRELVAARSDGALALLLGRPDPSLSPSSSPKVSLSVVLQKPVHSCVPCTAVCLRHKCLL